MSDTAAPPRLLPSESSAVSEPVDQHRPRVGFRQDIEGLRAVAVLAVVLVHAGMPGAAGGFVGVDIFFVISGFLITGMLWREVGGTGTIRLSRFYAARARRLLPASAAVGTVTVIGSALLLPPMQVRSVTGDGIASALYVANYRFALQDIDYFDVDRALSPFQHYWSLGVEEQFYLVWPPLLLGAAWLVRRRRQRTEVSGPPSKAPFVVLLTLVAAASFALSLSATRTAPPMAFFSLPTRAWELAVGGLVFLTAAQWQRLTEPRAALTGWAGLVLILLACTRLGAGTPYPGTAALLPVIGAAMVIGAGCATPDRGCGRLLALPPFQAVGRMSYSWYLWHWPVLLLLPALAGHPLGLAGRLAAVAASAGLAVLTLHLIENPIRFATPLRRSAIRSLALGGAVTAAAVYVGLTTLVVVRPSTGHGSVAQPVAITVREPSPGSPVAEYDTAVREAFAQVQSAVTAALAVKELPSNLSPGLADVSSEMQRIYAGGCMRKELELGQPECAMGDARSPTTVALVGDSHAAMWAAGFQRVATDRHWRLEVLTKGRCPLLDVPVIVYGREYTECEQWRAEILTRLHQEHPKLVVLDMSRGYGGRGQPDDHTSYTTAWFNSVTRMVQELRSTGAEVLVLGPIPDPQQPIPDCLAKLKNPKLCSAPRAAAVNEAGIGSETTAVEVGGGKYVDITPLFCTPDRCPAIIGNTLVYFDAYHTTLEYTKSLAPLLAVLADRAMLHS